MEWNGTDATLVIVGVKIQIRHFEWFLNTVVNVTLDVEGEMKAELMR